MKIEFFLQKDFYFQKNCTCYIVFNADYYPYHPNMMVRIYNFNHKTRYSNHVGGVPKGYTPLYYRFPLS